MEMQWRRGRMAGTPRRNRPSDGGRGLKRTGSWPAWPPAPSALAYATERALVARLRHRDDPDAGLAPRPRVRRHARPRQPRRRHDLHDLAAATGRRSCSAHGVTLSSRVWAKQFESFPAAGFRAVAFDSPRARRVGGRRRPATRSTTWPTTSAACSRRLDLHDAVLVGHSMGGMAVQAFAIRHPTSLHERVRGLVLQSTASHNLVSDARRVREALERLIAAGSRPRPRSCGPATSGSCWRAIGFGDDPAPEPRGGDPRDARGVQP